MKTEGQFAAFLFFVEDWLSSTAIKLMTAGEERGYLRLLLHSWKNPDCGLPNDDRALAQLSELGDAWAAGSGAVLRREFIEKDGRLYNPRLLAERENQQQIRQVRSGAGKSGAVARWQKQSKSDGKPIAKPWQKDAIPIPIPNTNTKDLGFEKELLLERLKNDTITDEDLERLYSICTDGEIEEYLGGVDLP